MEQQPSRIPLKLPLYEDPRHMKQQKLHSELTRRNLPVNASRNQNSLTLLNAMVRECNNRPPIDPLQLDDRQPEKYLLTANIAFTKMKKLQPDPDERTAMMDKVNRWIEQHVTSFEQLVRIARGDIKPQRKSELFLETLQFAASLMAQPEIETDARIQHGISSQQLRGSAFITQMCAGYIQIPEHLRTLEEYEKHINDIENNFLREYKRDPNDPDDINL